MVGFAIFFAIGVWLLQQQATLPDLRWAISILIFLLIYPVFTHNKLHRWIGILILMAAALLSGFFYAAGMAQYRLSDELPAAWQGRNISIIGVVADMPRQHERGLGFTFDVEQILDSEAHVPQHILLSTYQNENTPPLSMHAGERWQLTVRLKQPHGTSNPYTFEFEAWALERNLRAVGYVHNKGDNKRLNDQVFSPDYFVERVRESIRSHFIRIIGDAPYAGVLTALAIGDQASIKTEQWQIFTRTGVNHLMSISGLHITMLAGMIFGLVYWLWRRNSFLTLKFPARKAAATAGLIAALIYALISGFGIPAQRTVFMLGTISVALLSSRSFRPSQLLSVALLVVMLVDPWSVIAPGFWLSFAAVALIFYTTANRLGPGHWLSVYGRTQWAISIGLIPPLLAMFQQISLVSPLANAFAIPVVSFVVIPLTLLGAIFPFDWLLHLAHYVMSLVMLALGWLNTLPVAVWAQHAPPIWTIVTGAFGVLWILLPRGFPSRWIGGLLLVPMFLIQAAPPPEGSVRLTIFDVGQGLAVAVKTNNHALLYDTGPIFNSDANGGNRIIVPALKAMGISRLDELILTHNDTDHTGGALSVMQGMPVTLLSSTLPDDSPILAQATAKERCTDGQKWDWDGVHFELLHPDTADYQDDKISKNNLGCVLRISTGKNSVLFTADIEKNAESRLLEIHADKLKSTILVVPHHGSKTSSTTAFVAAVQPRYAIFASGYRNSFGHPKAEILERYRLIGSELFRSDEDGAILAELNADTVHLERYRKTHQHYWQQ